jgi:DNA-binding LacI/PurR family transcriptional regulator
MLLVLTQVANIDSSDDAYVAQTMRELSVDGVFVNRHGGTPPPFLERIRKLRIPAIFLNAKQQFDAVYPDDLAGGKLAAEFLLSLKHDHIAYVESEPRCIPHYSEIDRRAGYLTAMASAGRTPWIHQIPVDWRSPDVPGEDRRVEAAIQLLNAPNRPTAVIAYEFAESMAVVRAALIMGIKIPGDLSLIQFHNRIDDCAFIPVHTVSNMMIEVGEGAVGMLMEKIASPESAQPSKAIPETLIEGATCQAYQRPDRP